MSNYSISKKDITIFFVVTFGLTIAMGIAMGLVYSKHPVTFFVLLQMCYPAMGVMIALLSSRERRKDVPIKFFGTYLFFSITSVFYLILQIFIFNQDPGSHLGFWMIIGSMLLVFMYIDEGNEQMCSSGLQFSKNREASILYIVIFIILYIFRLTIAALILGGNPKDIFTPFLNPVILIKMLLLPLSFFVGIMPYMGEELGWRYFLQPILQKKIGKRGGIILLGLIWGIWHLPVNIFYHSPMSFYSVLNQLIVCVGYSAFLGLVYMKTENIWTISMIHYINNNLGVTIYGSTGGADFVFSWKSFLLNSICFSLIYLSFLCAKEYRGIGKKDHSKSS
ncbi:CPBP family intramembrane glutamic endopeptidase [Lutispora sp.]|uniref:CPBP family intramembrane glutamic endopeptidase n=1 Tax=Lutispora sp. TaxID=2828727 RepID=UPI002B21F5CE|nr:type II CAAX endopeptidase family protein [Lutispora sp.]MEA4961239.1 type II CAAX endopeptidase family protein [Lutispora sp.]